MNQPPEEGGMGQAAAGNEEGERFNQYVSHYFVPQSASSGESPIWRSSEKWYYGLLQIATLHGTGWRCV